VVFAELSLREPDVIIMMSTTLYCYYIILLNSIRMSLPINNLNIESIDALADAMNEYKGGRNTVRKSSYHKYIQIL